VDILAKGARVVKIFNTRGFAQLAGFAFQIVSGDSLVFIVLKSRGFLEKRRCLL